MAYRERQKISQMTPKGADLSATDLVEVSVLESGSYVTKSVTGLDIINAASGGALDLQIVTDNGNTTTTDLIVSVENPIDKTTVSDQYVKTESGTAGTYTSMTATGGLQLKVGDEESQLKNTNVTNTDVVLEFPNKATGSYTIATTEDITTPTLQEVTDAGNTTTTDIIVSDSVKSTWIQNNVVHTENNIENTFADLSSNGELILKAGAEASTLMNSNVTNAGVTLQFPNKTTGEYTIATTSDLTSGYIPYTGATQDVDLGNNKISIKSVYVTGTAGNGHIHIKHQSADATATGQSTAVWADTNGDIKWKNDGNYKTTLKTSTNTADRIYTFPNADCTLTPDSRTISTTAPLSGGGDLTINRTLSISQATTSTDGYLSSTDWNTFNNKASYTPRVQSVTSSATVTPVNTNDLVKITAQAAGLTLANPTGSWDEGQSLMIRIKDNGSAQTIAYGTNYRAIGVTLPTTTTANKTTYLGIIYNSTDTKWDVIGVTTQA